MSLVIQDPFQLTPEFFAKLLLLGIQALVDFTLEFLFVLIEALSLDLGQSLGCQFLKNLIRNFPRCSTISPPRDSSSQSSEVSGRNPCSKEQLWRV